MDSNQGHSGNPSLPRSESDNLGQDSSNYWYSVVDPQLLAEDHSTRAGARENDAFGQPVNQMSSQPFTPTYLVPPLEAAQFQSQPRGTITSNYPSFDSGLYSFNTAPANSGALSPPPMVDNLDEVEDTEEEPGLGQSEPENTATTRGRGNRNERTNQGAKQIAKNAAAKSSKVPASFKAMKRKHKGKYLKKVSAQQEFIGAVMGEDGVCQEVRDALTDIGIKDKKVLDNVTQRVQAYLDDKFQASLDIEDAIVPKKT